MRHCRPGLSCTRGLLSVLLPLPGQLLTDSGLEADELGVVPGLLVLPGSPTPELLLLRQSAASPDVQCLAHPLQGHGGWGVGHEAGELGIELEWYAPLIECT